ncbi:MAG: site-specific integrase [Myxococcales bacterium]|nr:site-specific integrase [Myxococcales bacterium]
MSSRGARGSVEALPSGSFRVRVSTASGERTSHTYATKEEAERMRHALVAVLGESKPEPIGGVTFGAFLSKLLDRRELARIVSVESERSIKRNYLDASDIATRPIASITTPDLGRVLERGARQRIKRPHPRAGNLPSRNMLKHIRALLSITFTAAVRAGLLQVNPCSALALPTAHQEIEPWTYLKPDEQRRLLECEAIPEGERLIVKVALGTGIRQSEQWKLKLDDVVIGDEPHILIRRPKNKRTRKVPLFGLALDAMRRWLEVLSTYSRVNPFGLVFPTATGCRRQARKPPRGWRDHLAAAGLVDPKGRHDGRPVRWHDLRHTCASSLVASWWGERWPIYEVSKLLGHSSVKVTERYAHLAESVLDERAARTHGRFRAHDFPKSGLTSGSPSTNSATSNLRVGGSNPSGRAAGDHGEPGGWAATASLSSLGTSS